VSERWIHHDPPLESHREDRVCTVCIYNPPPPTQDEYDDLQEKHEALEEKNDQLRSEVNDQAVKLEDAEEEVVDLKDKLENARLLVNEWMKRALVAEAKLATTKDSGTQARKGVLSGLARRGKGRR
jgi:predicted  nucleic acid-binding Zn-ribbon protein